MKENTSVYNQAIRMAIKTDFLQSSDEFFLYADAIYSAMMWSVDVNKKNRIVQERDKSLK